MSIDEFNLVYNAISFAIAAFGASTVFFLLQRTQVSPAYKTALTLSGLVCLITTYHYLRIFESFNSAYVLKDGLVIQTGMQFNNAYRYVDWLLTVPLLLLEFVLVLRLPHAETYKKGLVLTLAAAFMVILGYPGETLTTGFAKVIWWVLAMIPFSYILYEMIKGVGASIKTQPLVVQPLFKKTRLLIILSWSFYPLVYILPLFGLSAFVSIQVGFTFVDIVAKSVFGILIYIIAQRKSEIGA
ncbi:Xanthorhodopsin [Candidatus Methylopumilus planktonicus]|uniref:Xanthorhodopsin n=1 Tax=Candidatus Methylopumilus planktonicus TaxID=1581557 RepID=A0A0D6EVL9_9PROT|nr:bacteriorhodopsin [Candidatus Methylopumilus planktonicus]CEZ19484.1 Xanthorhodopsin [Candidatus Methylopumilus planktonicus]